MQAVRQTMVPTLLALDTATDRLAAALLAPGGRWCVNEAGGALASARLIPVLMALLERAGLGLAQVQAVAFGQGPGAFTGLRTACAVAQGLAFAHATPVLAIDSLLIVAEDARQQAAAGDGVDNDNDSDNKRDATGTDWWVAMDARMDEVYAAAYHHGRTGWTVQRAPQLYALPALVDVWSAAPAQRLAGNASSVFGGRLPLGTARCWPHTIDRAAALLRLAEAAWAKGLAMPAEQALPLYLRDKVAQTTAERAATRLALQALAPADVTLAAKAAP